MKVLKFGGSSVANAQNIQQVITIITKIANTHKVVVVVSAFGKTTNNLINAAENAQQKNEEYKNYFKQC